MIDLYALAAEMAATATGPAPEPKPEHYIFGLTLDMAVEAFAGEMTEDEVRARWAAMEVVAEDYDE
jgi:hypothetical protein